jgi:hypothetical protein
MFTDDKGGMIFNILIKEDEDMFIAHCLELDIVATADSVKQAQKDIIALVCAQVDFAFSNNNLDNLYHPAPVEIWKEFFACKEQVEKRYKLDAVFEKDSSKEVFVPPWIIAKTCQAQRPRHV